MAKRVLVGAALLLVLFAVAWFGTPEPEPAAPSPSGSAGDVVSAAAERTARNAPPKRAQRPAAEDSSPSIVSEIVPAPVDLDHADRDRDLFGVVVDAAGKGVAGANLATLTYPWRRSTLLNVRDRDVGIAGPATRSASDGTFAIRLTRGANVALRVSAGGFASIELPSVVAGERLKIVMGPGVRLVVVLTDTAGAPVAGANVRIFNNPDRGGPAIQAHATSGADGVCTFDGLPPSAWLWIDPKYPKGAAGWTRVTLPATGELRRDIKFPASGTLTGTVVDAETRHAIEGAEVGMNWVLDQSVKTKADGSFELPGWTGNGVNDVHVLAEGYAREAKIVGNAERLDFEMRRGFAVTGRVVGPDTSSVPGAIVGLIASDTSEREQRISTGYATTGADGRFRVAGLTVGMAHALVVAARGFARLRRETPSGTAAEDTALGDVVLGPPHRVEGVVVGSDGAPQARVPVILTGPEGGTNGGSNGYGQSVTAFTDDLGRFRFDDASPGAYTLKSRAEGAPEITAAATVPETGDSLGVKLVRESSREVVVTVVDGAGAAIANSYVSADGPSGRRMSSQTDAEGRARLAVPIASKLNLSVFAADPKREFLQSPPRELRDDEAAVTIVLEEGAAVTGRIVDPDGAPVAAAWIEFRGPGDARAAAQSDADGRFRTLVRRSGRSTLVFEGRVSRGDRQVDSGLTARVEDVAPGSDVAVRCVRLGHDRKLTVVVVTPSGGPVAGAEVQFWDHVGRTWPKAVTDATGRAVAADLPARDIGVSVTLTGDEFLPPAYVTAPFDAKEVRLSCRTATRITGTVVDFGGEPQPYGHVSATRSGEEVGWARVGRDARFALLLPSEDTAPVRLTIDLDGDGKPDASLDSVAPGTQDVRLVVRK